MHGPQMENLSLKRYEDFPLVRNFRSNVTCLMELHSAGNPAQV